MRQIVERSSDGKVTLEVETVFIVRGGVEGGRVMQYHSPKDAVFEFAMRSVSHGCSARQDAEVRLDAAQPAQPAIGHDEVLCREYATACASCIKQFQLWKRTKQQA